MQVAIDVDGVSKRYERTQALNQVRFQIPEKTVFSILGPNGAGKSTLIRILTTITRPDAGTARILGFDIVKDLLAVRQQVGVVAQDDHFDRYLSIWHNLTMHAEMHGLRRAEYDPLIRDLLHRVDLYSRRNDLTDTLSGGMQRRVSLIRALIHKPRVLFLDEPTTGLDPQARREIWETIEQFKQQSTVILTTHYMEEADRLSDDILLLNHGQVMNQGTPRELKRTLTAHPLMEMEFDEPVAAEVAAHLPPNTQPTVIDPYQLQFTVPPGGSLAAVMQHVNLDQVSRFGRKEADLESVFLAMASGRGAN
jgi:ABC-2 type transport system ATP-binding protein